MIIEASYLAQSVYSKEWDELTLADLWELYEQAQADFEYFSQAAVDCNGDQGNGLYEMEEYEAMFFDIWMGAWYRLEAVSSLIRGW